MTPEQARMAAERSGMPPVNSTPPPPDDEDDEETETPDSARQSLSDELLERLKNGNSPCPDCHGTLPDPDAVTTDADRAFMRDLGLDMTIGMTGIGGIGLGIYRAAISPTPASIGGVVLDALPGPNLSRAIPSGTPGTRPSWRQSEADVTNSLGPDYDTQKSFKKYPKSPENLALHRKS